jgi:CRP-like cAMP-binding protein
MDRQEMQQLIQVMRQMIDISEEEFQLYLPQLYVKTFKKNDILSAPDAIPNEIFFINKGIIRVLITDKEGIEHTIHFALENQYIVDYSNFILQSPSYSTLQAMEETEVVVLPRNSVEWGYNVLKEGQKLGRLIAEFYFIFQDNRIKNMYLASPRERYENITKVFPNIHNRVPQHMIASYINITSVHLSRLKKMKT